MSEHAQVEGRLELTELVLVGAEGELRVESSGGGDTRRAGRGSLLNGDGMGAEVCRHRAEDGLVEAVVVAEEDVAAAKAAVVLDHYTRGRLAGGHMEGPRSGSRYLRVYRGHLGSACWSSRSSMSLLLAVRRAGSSQGSG